jgi:L-seryl-tRNA(Ser) seleniumtransferase
LRGGSNDGAAASIEAKAASIAKRRDFAVLCRDRIREVASERLRQLPSVDRLLQAMDGVEAPHGARVAAARGALEEARRALRSGEPAPELSRLVEAAEAALLRARRPSLVPVINATGVILQTNLGRAPLSERALRAMEAVSRGYSNLEFDLEAGERGSRHEHVRGLIRQTTGAEDGLVVNNNAAALLMVLQVFASGREVVVSRGQAVEIGGGFRIPDVMRQSGARLVEVGTTNRTYARDYASAIGEATAALLRVHSSNFRVVGFTAAAALEEMAALARERGVFLFDDLGSGCLLDTAKFGLAPEPTVQESIRAGVDLALFSGDKLLGGPQCGVIAGRAALVETLRKHPLARALRVDRMTIAALNATLEAYAEGRAVGEIPVWRMIAADPGHLRKRARRWAAAAGANGRVERSRSMVGGGSLPGEGLDTWCATVTGPEGATRLAARLRQGDPAVVARIENERVLLDPRTVDPRQDRDVATALRTALATRPG